MRRPAPPNEHHPARHSSPRYVRRYEAYLSRHHRPMQWTIHRPRWFQVLYAFAAALFCAHAPRPWAARSGRQVGYWDSSMGASPLERPERPLTWREWEHGWRSFWRYRLGGYKRKTLAAIRYWLWPTKGHRMLLRSGGFTALYRAGRHAPGLHRMRFALLSVPLALAFFTLAAVHPAVAAMPFLPSPASQTAATGVVYSDTSGIPGGTNDNVLLTTFFAQLGAAGQPSIGIIAPRIWGLQGVFTVTESNAVVFAYGATFIPNNSTAGWNFGTNTATGRLNGFQWFGGSFDSSSIVWMGTLNGAQTAPGSGNWTLTVNSTGSNSFYGKNFAAAPGGSFTVYVFNGNETLNTFTATVASGTTLTITQSSAASFRDGDLVAYYPFPGVKGFTVNSLRGVHIEDVEVWAPASVGGGVVFQGDTTLAYDFQTTAASRTVTTATSTPFVAGRHEGMQLLLHGAGFNATDLETTIIRVNSTSSITISNTPSVSINTGNSGAGLDRMTFGRFGTWQASTYTNVRVYFSRGQGVQLDDSNTGVYAEKCSTFYCCRGFNGGSWLTDGWAIQFSNCQTVGTQGYGFRLSGYKERCIDCDAWAAVTDNDGIRLSGWNTEITNCNASGFNFGAKIINDGGHTNYPTGCKILGGVFRNNGSGITSQIDTAGNLRVNGAQSPSATTSWSLAVNAGQYGNTSGGYLVVADSLNNVYRLYYSAFSAQTYTIQTMLSAALSFSNNTQITVGVPPDSEVIDGALTEGNSLHGVDIGSGQNVGTQTAPGAGANISGISRNNGTAGTGAGVKISVDLLFGLGTLNGTVRYTCYDSQATMTQNSGCQMSSSCTGWQIHGSMPTALNVNGSLNVGTAAPTVLLAGWVVNAKCAQITNTTNVMADVTGLGFAVGKNEQWVATFELTVTGPVGGTKFQITGPGSPTNVRYTILGDTSAVTAVSTETATAFSTVSAAYVVSITGIVRIMIALTNGANAGTVQLQFDSTTNGNSSLVLQNSFMEANRIA